MKLEYTFERDGGWSSRQKAEGKEAIRHVLRELARQVFAPNEEPDLGGKRACTLAIEKLLETHKYDHGTSGLTDAVEAELKTLHELHPDRVQIRLKCLAHDGIVCDYAKAVGVDTKICDYKSECAFAQKEAI